MNLESLEKSLEYTFQNKKLLLQALVHKSYLNDRHHNPEVTMHNERLEFLGDAVLEMVVTDYLFKNIAEQEGVLTALRAALVNYKTMGEVGAKLGLEDKILLSKGEKEELGKARLSIVADTSEAVIGAMYIDGGMQPCVNLINKHILIYLPNIIATESWKDAKTIMQEYCQKHTRITPRYRLISSEGKDHEKLFTIGVWVGTAKMGEGQGKSKQDAETEAAKVALLNLKKQYEQ
jgi:ribonuclease III